MSHSVIWVVDDDPGFRDLLKDALAYLGWEVRTFSSPREAIHTLQQDFTRENRNLIILSDFMMPEINGMTFLSKVKVIRPDVPFIFMTAFGTSETFASAVAAGATSVLRKPFPISRLIDSLREIQP